MNSYLDGIIRKCGVSNSYCLRPALRRETISVGKNVRCKNSATSLVVVWVMGRAESGVRGGLDQGSTTSCEVGTEPRPSTLPTGINIQCSCGVTVVWNLGRSLARKSTSTSLGWVHWMRCAWDLECRLTMGRYSYPGFSEPKSPIAGRWTLGRARQSRVPKPSQLYVLEFLALERASGTLGWLSSTAGKE